MKAIVGLLNVRQKRKGKQQFMASGIYLPVLGWRMNCNLRFREERIGALLKVPRLSDSPLKRMHWVQCKGCKCLAVTDSSGKWLCMVTGEDLASHITEVFSN